MQNRSMALIIPAGCCRDSQGWGGVGGGVGGGGLRGWGGGKGHWALPALNCMASRI